MIILVVDDDRVTRSIFRKELQKHGYTVLEASDGFEALHTIHNQKVDLVTLDIEMPDMDGYQVCTWLRSEQFSQRFQEQKNSLLPVVFVTSTDTLEGRLKGFRAGATDFIVKGFKPGELADCVDKILKPVNPLHGMTALVIDDSKLVREMVTTMLMEQGVKVHQACDGQEGYNFMESRGKEIDLVLTDLEMPIMKGDELCLRIRKNMGMKELPIIFLTATPDRSALIHLFQVGANDYLIKPFVKEELIARLKVITELSRTITGEMAQRRRVEQDLAKTKELAETKLDVVEDGVMAATVLHNVKNVLNSVSVSSAQIESLLGSSSLPHLLMALRLFDRNKSRIAEFLTQDEKGRQLTQYLCAVQGALEEQHLQLVEEVAELNKKMSLIKDIVITQQKRTSANSDMEVVLLEDLVKDALLLISPFLVGHGVKVIQEYEEGMMVKADPRKMAHILVNLFKNAGEAMSLEPLKELHVLSGPLNEAQAFLKIADTGSGITPEQAGRIFEHGFTTKKQGQGLGLPYCLQTMREMNGDLKVYSEGLGKGATFTLRIPRAD